MSKNYWKEREKASRDRMLEKSSAAIENQLKRYYKTAAAQTIQDFENVYLKLLSTIGEGRTPTPADLYKLGTYWALLNQLEQQTRKLNDRTVSVMRAGFIKAYNHAYKEFAIEGMEIFNKMDSTAAEKILNRIWCADGKNWSERVWKNTLYLKNTLNDELIKCIATGKNPRYLKEILQKRFSVSYGQSSRIIRTEIAYIQRAAAQERYKDYGIQNVEVLADNAGCDECAELNGKIYSINENIPIPLHPNCRCCIIPVID